MEQTITIPLSEYEAMKAHILSMERVVMDFEKVVVGFNKQIAELKEQIRLLRNGHNSNTSSTPPSQYLGKSNSKSLRPKSKRNSGGQSGHTGSTLQMKQTADIVEHYTPDFCNHCGTSLEKEASVLIDCKQEIVLPPVDPQCIEHRSYAKTCPVCAKQTISDLPSHLVSNIQYGANVEALIGYLSVHQYIPYRRMVGLLQDCFGLSISEGSIDNILERLKKKSLSLYGLIKQRIERSEVIGSDETGVHTANKKGWLHTWQTPTLTFIAHSFERGFSTIRQLFQTGFPESVLVSDCWAAQLKTPAKTHQICMAHLQRELNNFIDALQCDWSTQMKTLLCRALEIKQQQKNDLPVHDDIAQLETQLDQLLATDMAGKHKKVQAFIKRLNKYRNYIFTFLYYSKVPPDNNASERAIRNAKVKSKVSGCFRSQKGAERFAVLRSITDTARKNHQNPFDAFFAIANLTDG